MIKSSPSKTKSPKRSDFGGEKIAEMASSAQKSGLGDQTIKTLPPVESWNPDFCGDIDMEIRRDGRWYHEGSLIIRKEMVTLFASILRKDTDGRTYLVTPVEKVGIKVEDAHFIAVEMQVLPDRTLRFRTQLGDYVDADENHALRFDIDPVTGGVKPYIIVRGRLEALLTRALTYDLMALGEEAHVDGEPMFVIRSKQQIFTVMAMRDFERFG
ncbi:DUF1285 domain-containing protein [Brucellaceae bacterium C25G]